MAYLVVEVHHAYKIWCPPGAVKEKPGKKENSSNSLRGGDFHQDKTAIFSNGCFRPRIFSPSVRSGTRRVVTDDPLRLFRIPGVRTGRGEGGPGIRFASSFPPGPGGQGAGWSGRKFFLQNFSTKKSNFPPKEAKFVLILADCCVMYTVDNNRNGSHQGKRH